MDTMPMFAFEEFEQGPSPDDTDETGCEPADIPVRERFDDDAGIEEEHEPDPTEIAATNPQGSSGPAGDSAGNGELVPAEETASIYEATGLIGPFKLNPIALIFPESPEDLADLAASIEAIGVLEEPTVAWTQGTENPPEVIDGKRIIQAAEIAGVQPTYRLLRRDIDPRDYVWAKNGERRNLSPSQKAIAFALLYPKLGPGRPPGPGKNCQLFNSFSRPTQGQGAKKQKVSRPLINQAYKIADPNGRMAPEVMEAVRDGTVRVSDAVKKNVSNVSHEVQRAALSLVKDGRSTTMAAAVAKVERDESERLDIPPIKLDRPTRLGNNLVLYGCSVDRLKKGLETGDR